MPYRLLSEEPVLNGLKRIVAEEASSSSALLRSHDRRKRDEAIHESRKSVKKIRGLLRLLEPGARRWFRLQNGAARDIGRLLSEFRDAAVMLETAGQLAQQAGTEEQRATLQTIKRTLSRDKRMLESERDLAKSAAHAAGDLTGFAAAFETEVEKAVTSEGFPSLAAGLRKTYGRGRKALAKARAHPSALHFHEFRKRVKDRWYQTRLLAEVWDKEMQRQEKGLKQLETLLGEDHNAQVLQEKMGADPARYGGEQACEVVSALAQRWQERLRSEAVKLSDSLYERKPRVYLADVSKLWSDSARGPEQPNSGEKSSAKKKTSHVTAGKSRRGAAA